MKRVLTMAIIGLLCSSMFSILASTAHATSVGSGENGILIKQWEYAMQPLYSTILFGSSPAIGDLLGDSNLEIVTGSDEYHNYYPELGYEANGIWRCFDSEGNIVWAKDTGTDESRSSPAIADIDKDGYFEIVAGTTSGWNVEVMDRFGNFKWTFPWPPAQGGPFTWHSSPAVGDVDPHISGLEVFIGNNPYGNVWSLQGDNKDGMNDGITATDPWIYGGTEGIDWDVLWKFDTGASVLASPALGDIDNDGQMEVVVGSGNGNLYVFDGITGTVEWSYLTGGPVDSSAAIADLDGDGYLEMVIGSADGNVYSLEWNGGVGKLEWIFSTGSSIYSSPAVGDIDSDGLYEIVVGSDNGNVYGISNTGALEWSYSTGDAVRSSAALANRGAIGLDVYIGSNDNYLYLLDGTTGSLIDRFLTNGPLYTSPSAADVDGDGKLEIFLYDAGTSGVKDNYTFWAIEDTGSTVSAHSIEWQMFRHDARRTGNYLTITPPPTPADTIPPVISNVRHEPLYPLFGDEIFFYADVTDNVAVDEVQLNFTLDGGSTWLLKDMSLLEGDTYSTSLGPYAQYQIIGFYVIAYDTSGNMAWGSEIVPPLPEPPKVAPVVVSDENPAPLPNGQDVWYDTTDASTTVFVDLWELGLYSPTLLYYIWYSIDGGLTWIKEELTQVTDYIRKFDVPSLTNILFRIETSDGTSSKVYWIIIGPWKYPIYLYFSTNEKYYPVGLDFDYDQTGDYDIANNKASYDTYFSNYRPQDLDGDGVPDAPAYAYMNPKSIDDGSLVVEYWIYYAFNDYAVFDKHEHDFESVYLWIDLSTGHIKRLACSQHAWVNHYLFDVKNPPGKINLAVEEGGHGMALLDDKDSNGLPDTDLFGSYTFARTSDHSKSPWFWGTFNSGSFVAQLYPWVIYDPRIQLSKLHLFGDTSILTTGLSLSAIQPLLPSLVDDVPKYYDGLLGLLSSATLLRTSYGFELPVASDSKLAFKVTAPLFRQEFREPAKFWNKIPYGWWAVKQTVKIVIGLFVIPHILAYFGVAGTLGFIVGIPLNQLTGWVLSVLFDPVQGSAYDFQGHALDCSSVFNDLPGGVFVTTRNITQDLYDLALIFTNSANDYAYEVRGTADTDAYNFTVSRMDKDGNENSFNAIEIPIHLGEVHRYVINWTMLENAEQGVEVFVDKNGDGTFEQRFHSDSELTHDEFEEATADEIPPTTKLEIGEPKFADPIKGLYVSSSTSFTLIAEDNPGGTGVASTTYRIYNATYDSGWLGYSASFYLTGLSDGEYSIDYYSADNVGNTEPTNTATVILDNTAPTTTLTMGEPKYISDKSYVTPDTPFTLGATDTGSGVYTTAYRIYNAIYDSGWQTYITPFKLVSLTDGTYTIEYNSTDNVKNIETTHSVNVTLFSWNYIFEDTYGRGTTLKINIAHKFFQFIAPDKDYGIRNATYLRLCGRAIIIQHRDSELRLITVAVDTKLDFCLAMALNMQTCKCYLLIDKPGIEK